MSGLTPRAELVVLWLAFAGRSGRVRLGAGCVPSADAVSVRNFTATRRTLVAVVYGGCARGGAAVPAAGGPGPGIRVQLAQAPCTGEDSCPGQRARL